MGAWGTGIKQNDRALDFAIMVIRNGFEIATDNEDYLILADMCINYKYILNKEELDVLNKAIKEEVANIDNWKEECREDRIKILTKISEEIKRRCY